MMIIFVNKKKTLITSTTYKLLQQKRSPTVKTGKRE